MTGDLEAFTSSLARQIRQQEKKRFWRLVAVACVLIIVVMFILIQMQQHDEKLRLQLRKQCEARNAILDIQRTTYQDLTVKADEEERDIWLRLLNGLPPNVDCTQYIRTPMDSPPQ